MTKSKATRVEGLAVKSGPTQSGGAPVTPVTTYRYVGGVIESGFNYWALGLLSVLFLCLGLMIYRSRSKVMRFFAPVFLRLLN